MMPYTNIQYKEIGDRSKEEINKIIHECQHGSLADEEWRLEIGDKYIIFIYVYIHIVISTCYNEISEIYFFLIYVLIFTAEHHNIR